MTNIFYRNQIIINFKMNKKLSPSELDFFLRLGFIPPGCSGDYDSQYKLKLFGNTWQNEATDNFASPFFQDKNIGTKSIGLYADEWFESFKKIVKSSMSYEQSVALFLSGGKDSHLIAYAQRDFLLFSYILWQKKCR
jgi:hypothetical protein